MKKWLIFLVCTCFILTGCKPNKTDDKKDPIPESNSYSLGAYGDYVQYTDTSKDSSNLEKEYLALKEKKSLEKNGLLEETYPQGLIDFFTIENKIKLTIEITKEELEKLDLDYQQGNKESYRICNLDIQFNGLIFHFEQVGIRQKGNSSRGAILDEEGKIYLRHYKLSFSETFDDEFRDDPIEWTDQEALAYREDRTFFGLEKLNIRWNRNKEKTYIREYYAFETYRANGVLAPHTNPMQVEMKIGNQIENLGVYLGVEDINKDFIKRNLASELTGGDLYKLGWTTEGAKLDKTDDRLFGVEKQVKSNGKFNQIGYCYDLKTNKKKSTHEAIKNFIRKINQTSVQDFYTFFHTDFDYDTMISYLAISYLLGDPDDLRGNFNNVYLYFVPNTNQAIIIPTDNDRVLGSTGGSGNPTRHYGTKNNPFDAQTGYSMNDMPLFTKSILEFGNKQIQKDYLERIQKIIEAKWMDIDTFKQYYTLAEKNYSSCLQLGSKVHGTNVSFGLVEGTSLSGEDNLSIEVYFNTKKQTALSFEWDSNVEYSEFYFRGEANNWNGISKEYGLIIIDGIPTLEIYINHNQSFKIADSSWNKEFNYEDLVDKEGFESKGDHKNIGVLESGEYRIQILNYGKENEALSIMRKDNQ